MSDSGVRNACPILRPFVSLGSVIRLLGADVTVKTLKELRRSLPHGPPAQSPLGTSVERTI